jgi:hypothetical protein
LGATQNNGTPAGIVYALTASVVDEKARGAHISIWGKHPPYFPYQYRGRLKFIQAPPSKIYLTEAVIRAFGLHGTTVLSVTAGAREM